ncbi:MAG: hypothetical protein HOF11_11305, partial [Rhodospirillaceae bacterium]|nr:hypothetical protein [Rhodospirillaceae bacterium]
WGAAAAAVAGLTLAAWLYADLGRMRFAVLAYTFVIVAMAASALLSSFPASMLAPGAILFMASDCGIAVRRFKMEFPFSGELTWMGYYSGQLLIFLAITNV